MIDVDIESEDKENSNFFILYKESADDIFDLANVNDDDYFLEPLINDYLKGWVKIVSIDTDPIKIWFLRFLINFKGHLFTDAIWTFTSGERHGICKHCLFGCVLVGFSWWE